jgi:cell fate (sporulation/competence/biofilm development) regulator YlbF (YheA/YmcA/DUF963 family)
MDYASLNELEITSSAVVLQSAKLFAQTLTNTPQYKNFELAYTKYRNDSIAQNSLKEFQQKQSSLKALIMLNAVSDEDRDELQRLHDGFYHLPSVLQYSKMQEELVTLCQEIGDQLSEAIGLDFASSCRTGGCCG